MRGGGGWGRGKGKVLSYYFFCHGQKIITCMYQMFNVVLSCVVLSVNLVTGTVK